jgi:hypothetical protein
MAATRSIRQLQLADPVKTLRPNSPAGKLKIAD